MTRRIVKEEIGDYAYEITLLDAEQNLEIGHKLLSVATTLVDEKADISQSIGAAFSRMGPKEFVKLVDIFAEHCKVRLDDGNAPTLSKGAHRWREHFSGDMGGLLEWFIACVMANFSGLGASGKRLKSKYSHLIETDEPETDEADVRSPENS